MKRLLTATIPELDITLTLYERERNHSHLSSYIIYGENFNVTSDTFMFGTHLDPYQLTVEDREYAVSIFHSVLTKLTGRLLG